MNNRITFIIEVFFRDGSESEKLITEEMAERTSYWVRSELIEILGNTIIEISHDEGVTLYLVDVVKKIEVYEPVRPDSE